MKVASVGVRVGVGASGSDERVAVRVSGYRLVWAGSRPAGRSHDRLGGARLPRTPHEHAHVAR